MQRFPAETYICFGESLDVPVGIVVGLDKCRRRFTRFTSEQSLDVEHVRGCDEHLIEYLNVYPPKPKVYLKT